MPYPLNTGKGGFSKLRLPPGPGSAYFPAPRAFTFLALVSFGFEASYFFSTIFDPSFFFASTFYGSVIYRHVSGRHVFASHVSLPDCVTVCSLNKSSMVLIKDDQYSDF
jgi:hypothetical protein